MTTQTKIPTCHQCNIRFESWKELAQHIIKEKRTHKNRNSRIWASKVLCEKKDKPKIKPVASDPDKKETALGEENRENRSIQLSGEFSVATCICPKCKNRHKQSLEVEFLSLEHLWLLNEKPAVFCESCRK